MQLSELRMDSGTVCFTVSLTPKNFEKIFLVLIHMGHFSYSCSHIRGFPGGVTIQRSDLTLAFSEIVHYFLSLNF